MKGHLKSKAIKSYSKKLNTNVRKQKQKLKNHKGLLKRIKIVPLILVRWALDGIENSNFNLQDPSIFTDIKAEPTSLESVELDTCIRPILTRLRSSSLTIRENH
jgi:hypothetical protein